MIISHTLMCTKKVLDICTQKNRSVPSLDLGLESSHWTGCTSLLHVLDSILDSRCQAEQCCLETNLSYGLLTFPVKIACKQLEHKSLSPVIDILVNLLRNYVPSRIYEFHSNYILTLSFLGEVFLKL